MNEELQSEIKSRHNFTGNTIRVEIEADSGREEEYEEIREKVKEIIKEY